MTDLPMMLLETGGPVAVVAAGAKVAQVKAPRAYWSTVGLPVATARLVATWRPVMEACGLAVTPSATSRTLAQMRGTVAKQALPRRRWRSFRPSTTGVTLRVKLRPGQTPGDFRAASERLRHAWGAFEVHVKSPRPGWVELRIVAWDVLADVRLPRRTHGDFLRVPVALRSDGRVHYRDFREVAHELVLGATDSGKSVYLRNLVTGLAPWPVGIVGIDCKWGVELAPFGPRLSALATTPEEAAKILDVLVAEMEERFILIRRSQHIPADVPDGNITSNIWGLPEELRPIPIVLIVDEIAELFLTSAKRDERRDRMVNALIRLAQLGRAAGIYVEACGQRFGSELGNGATMLRAQLSGRTCHRVNDDTSARMALADISEEAVIAATSIAPERKGVAIVGDTSGGWTQIRTQNLNLGVAAALCRDMAHMVPDITALAEYAPRPMLHLADAA